LVDGGLQLGAPEDVDPFKRDIACDITFSTRIVTNLSVLMWRV
jgi:hypothetical protein